MANKFTELIRCYDPNDRRTNMRQNYIEYKETGRIPDYRICVEESYKIITKIGKDKYESENKIDSIKINA